MPGRTIISDIGAQSSRKRGRRADDDDNVVVETVSARSNLRVEGVCRIGNHPRSFLLDNWLTDSNQNKRARISTASDADKRASTPESGDDRQADDSNNSPAKTQYELLRDNNFEHLQHENADDQRATQRLRVRSNRLGDNAVADNGILESITCVNFMCHQRLHVELGPLLNFIVGENGSGKSAILTAITLCLGGKASSTNRGGSLKSFVKEGCERAVLSVRIKNQGQDAYKQDIYGDSIIVERHFSKTGTSGFKVKSVTGSTCSTKKQEVEDIVEYYALQVDNPLNVLSQDNARQFLNACSKQQKYKFFIEGVQLQQLDNDYRLISESLEQMIAKIPEQEERVKHAQKVLQEANRMKEAIEGNRQIRVRVRVLRHQMIWSQVVFQERELDKRKQNLAEAEVRVQEAEANLAEKNKMLQHCDEKIERAQEAVKTAKEEEQEYRSKMVEAQEAFKNIREEVQKLHVEEREAHSALKNASDNLKDLKLKIEAEEKRLEDTNGEAHTLKLQELEKAKQDVESILQQIEEVKAREPDLINQQEDGKKRLKAVSDEHHRKHEEMQTVDVKIRQLEQNRGSVYDAYEAGVPRLVQMIENERSFNEKPIGPLGAHVKLLKPEWSAILEHTLGRNLNAFVVTSKSDQTKLQAMMNRLNVRNCPILIGSRQRINLEGKEPDPSFDTILRVLQIDNLAVRDQLIINNMIEQVLLIPQRVKAEEVMFEGAPPRNVKACLSFHDVKREGLRLTVNATGGPSTAPIQPKGGMRSRMLPASNDTQVAYLRDSLNALDREARAADSEKRRLQQDLQKLQAEFAKNKKERTTLENRLRHARVVVEQVESDLDQFDNADGKLEGLKEQYTEAKELHEHLGRQYGALGHRKQEKNQLVEEARDRLKEEKLQLREYEARTEKVDDKLKRYQDNRRIVLAEVNEAAASLELFQEEVKKATGKVERQIDCVKEFADDAVKHSPDRVEVPDNETYKSLEDKYNALAKKLKAAEDQRGMTDEQVMEHLAEAKKSYDNAKRNLQSMKEVNQGLRNTLSLRLEKWRKFQRYISSQSRANFIYLLAERGFRGKLLLDHERKALDLQVEPDKTERKAQGRNTKTLSGGEKSFSNICLLLSIWEAMGSPLRCLDEFDVFMDNVNRAISTNMLVSFGFILWVPWDFADHVNRIDHRRQKICQPAIHLYHPERD